VKFLEKVEKDIDYLKSKNQSEYIAEYLEHFDLTETLRVVEQRKALNAIRLTKLKLTKLS